jgi:glycosyltransferase involved in cell wall biosynthesis
MKIGIDARMYGPSHSGLGRYVQQLVEQLKMIDDENEYVIFLKREQFDSFSTPNSKWKKVLADVHWYTVGEQILFPKIIKKEHVDLMHFPHWNVPLLYRKKFVVTIHDLIMFHFSRREATTHGPVIYFLKDMAHRFILKSASRRAKHIFATSEFTKNDIVETLKVDSEKISVTYQASSQNTECQMSDVNVLKKFNIAKPYVLYVGNAYPHKNLGKLVSAWKLFSKENFACQLVLAGKDSSFFQSIKVDVLAKECDDVIFTGFVTDKELNELYDSAHLYVFPSLYEGFGLPPLEAIQHNVPVISSNASCMPEVLGTGALYFDPENIEDIVHALEEGTKNEEIRYTLRQNAKHELKKYSWEKLAAQTHAEYTK